jgi:beta-1,4-mannosyltransferase
MAMASAPVLDPATIYLTTPRSGSFLNSPKTMAQILSASEILAEKADYLRQHVTDETVLALALPAQSRYLKLALHWHGPAGMVRVAMTFAGHGVPLTHHPPRAAIALALRAVATSIFGRRGFNLYEAKGGRADRPIRVMLQLRSCTNPYVGLLQGSTGPGVEVRWFSFKQALLGDFDVFHMHFPVYWASGRRPGRRMMGGLALRLVFWLRGDRVVYTVHDLEPHLPLSPLRQWLFGLWAGGNARVYLTEWSKAAAHDPDGVVIKHGSYRELFAGCPLPAKAAEPRLVHFGALRWYRGTEDLLDAFGQLPPDSDVSLHILGRPVHGSTVAASVAQCARQPRLKADLRLVSDEELWEGVGAATLAVLPYRWITNSGPAIFAVSAGTPVLMPDSELARELQSEFGAYWIRTYEPPLTGARLAAEVQDVFLHQSCETLPPMDGWDWAGHIGPQYAEVYRTVAGAPRSRRWGYPRTDSQDPRRGS